MGHIFAVFSPCELTAKDRREAEGNYPGLRFPDEGRLPSRMDIEAALAAHPDWQVEFRTGEDWWTAFVRSPTRTASLRIDHYSGDPARPHSFHFDTGDADLVADVASAIAERCGPFLVVDESGLIVVLVNPDGSRSDLGAESAGGSRPCHDRRMIESPRRYFELSDDMSTDQRWYLDDPEGPGGEALGSALHSCQRYEGKSPLSVRVHHPGPPLEVTMTLFAIPVVNERVAKIFAAHIGQDAQIIPARVTGADAKLWVVNVLAMPDCFDEVRTTEFRRWTAEDGRPDRIGDYRMVSGLRIDSARAVGHTILRPRRCWQSVIVNEALAEALQKASVNCELKLVS